ncbi:amino acid adenylation domain-containing protein [Pseudomonas auratipiscis]|uniref:Amino acid adenylation domain-containing protein n=1 Tax=Pseudomonas auratipiscis TaxID=3115853 RepID=A0AB35WS85_9PSED|nr:MULTISPECIES: amino acid adenylation domain-containing protein [unclassified Pseudomonas]MEE1866823.1 amino acid adenylation domain-containing protein [Pseudomonas sp. 120P]MEE1958719.1 amino acid adenylation domain-containing protein [Pseudomonas sp. 119P]
MFEPTGRNQQLVERIKGLSADKRRQMFAKLHEMGIDVAKLPIVPSCPGERAPLSYAQQRQWFLWQLEPHSSAYHIPSALLLRGVLNVEHLRQSFATLVERHACLRTRFVEADGQVSQQVEATAQVVIEQTHLHAEGAQREALMRACVAELSAQPFDLLNGPLLRVRLVRLADDEHLLVLVLHHIVTDGWSMSLMVEELMACYAACAQGLAPAQTALPIQYVDFAAWQRQWMESGEGERQLTYWKSQLGEIQDVLELPSDHPRPPTMSYRGGRLPIAVPDELDSALRQLAQGHGVSLFVLLLASFMVLLQRYSGQGDIRVGVPVANRNRLETERLIGLFVNTQVLATRPRGDESFAVLLQRIDQQVGDAQTHQDLPFEHLVEALGVARSLSHNPLFQAMHNHQDGVHQAQSMSLSGLTVEALEWDAGTAQLDLTLETQDSGHGLSAALIYARDLFEHSSIERMARHWLNLLRAIVASPQAKVAELALLDAEETVQIVEQWNATAADYPLDTPVHRLIEQQVQATPDAPALCMGAQQLSYRELDQRANQLAHQLIALGVGPEVLVGIAVERSIDMVIGLLAILKAGGAYVPLDPEYPEERLAYMIEDSRIALLLTQSHLRLPCPAELPVLALDQLVLERFPVHAPAPQLDPEHLAYVIYTSGSTGKPKGAGNRHKALSNRLCWMQQAYGLGAGDTVLQKTPFSFDVSVWEFFWPLMTGARLAMAAPGDHRDPRRLVALIHAHQVTTLHFVPSMLQMFLLDEQVASCTGLRRIICSGEALPVDAQAQVLAKLPNAGLYNLYGPTEAAIDVTHWTCRDEGRDAVPIGEPIANLQTYVLDAELNALPVGVVGELYLGGMGLARGYHRRAALTAERFVTSPFGNGARLYRTGDLASQRADGVIEYRGRIDHQVKIRGLRIELGEIEARLMEQDAVREAVVLAIDAALVAYVVPTDWAPQRQEALRDAIREPLRQALPDYMVPAQLLFIEHMPLSPNGKLERKALPKPDANRVQKSYVAPRTAVEQQIAAIWQDVLKIEQVGLADNFFELGGDSIISIQVVSRARQAGIRFSPKDLFQHQTVQSLAAVAETGETAHVIDQGPVQGEALLMPFQHWFFDTLTDNHQHWNQSLLLAPREPLQVEALDQALGSIVRHHDALRLHFHNPNGQGWSARFAETRDNTLLWQLTVADEAQLNAAADTVQRSLDLQQGPLLRALLATLADGSQRLLLVVHHLVVDGVSWRILLEDLQSAYQQSLAGQEVRLPAKTHSIKVWAEQLQADACSPELEHQLAFWQAQAVDAELPCQRPAASLFNRDACHVQTRLDADVTRRLLQEAPTAYRTRVNDLLLTALARVLVRWSGHPSVAVLMEGHGREPLSRELDLTRSVGWFTSFYPLKLTPVPALADSIKQIKEQLRAVPDHGMGYGALRYLGSPDSRQALAQLTPARVTFNYLGQLDAGFAQTDGLFVPSNQARGQEQDAAAPLPNWLTLNGQVYGGELLVDWQFSAQMFDEATVQALADAYTQALHELIEHCCSAGIGALTPADVPLAKLEQQQLDQLGLDPRAVQDLYPLSPMQQGMLFHSLYAQAPGQYINQMSVTVQGLDLQRFQAAWQATVDAHDILRTAFLTGSNLTRPLQVVQRAAQVPFLVEDWRNRADQAEAIEAWAEAQRSKGFALERAPLLTLHLLRLDEQRYTLIYTSHHILMDGWSNAQLLAEVLQRYSGVALADQAGRYRDYIAWLDKQDPVADERFWKAHVQHLDAPTRLAATLPDPPQGLSGYAEFKQTLEPDITQRLKTFASQHKVTLNTLIQAAWALLLQRYSGQPTVAFGATVAGRSAPLPGIEAQVGLFINTLPVVVSLSPEQSLVQVLQTLQAQNLALRDHEHTPLFDIQRWAGQGGEGLFDSLLVFENYPVSTALQEGAPQGLRFTEVQTREQTSYPLTLLVAVEDRLTLQFQYARAHFSASQVQGFGAHLSALLHGMLAAPGALGELPMLTAGEYQCLLHDWNASTLPPAQGCSIAALIARQVQAHPEQLALIDQHQHLSYRQLDQQANRLAHHLISLGVGAEVRVGVALERSSELIVALLAVLKAGGAYVPLDPDYPAERLAYMLADSRAEVLITQASVLGALVPPAGTCIVQMQVDAPWLAEQPDSAPPLHLSADNLAYVIYTSGSTGQPKGVAITHRNVEALIHWSQQAYSREDIQGVLASTSVCFDLSVWEIFVTLASGGSLILARNALALPELPARDQVRLINTVPSAIAALLRAGQIPASVRIINLAGEPLKQALVEQLYQLPGITQVNDLYGPSEDTTYSTWTRREAGGTATIGRPLPGTGSFLLDASLQPAPQGVAAELYLSGAGLTRGYLGRAALTAERFVPNPFSTAGERLYRTSDLTRYRPDARIEYLGRIDHQVKIRGFRIELGEIEARLLAQDSVREAAVLAVEHQGSAQLVAYIAAHEHSDEAGQQATLRAQIKARLGDQLPGYMVPAFILFLAQLPLTPNGKLDRKALPEVEQPPASAAFQAPCTALEQQLAEVWQQVLDVERVGVDDHFFELGGHSLLATQVVSRLQGLLAVPVSLRDLFDHPRLQAFAQLLQARSTHATAPQRPALSAYGEQPEAPLSLAQRRLWVVEQLSAGTGAYGMPLALRLQGELQVPLLRASLAEVFRRHQVLRTAYVSDDEGDPMALVSPTVELDLPLLDLSALSRAEQETQVAQAVLDNASNPISLLSAPLMRGRVVRLSATEHVVLYAMHHIISDGWSMSLLVNELVALYSLLHAGKPAELTPLKVQYSDYARWQQALQSSGVMALQADYWKRTLAAYSGQLPLPTDYPRTNVASTAGNDLQLHLDGTLVQRLMVLAAQANATLYSTLLAAFQVLLHRISASDDLVVGADVAGRQQPELEQLIGFFVNVLPLRSRYSAEQTFSRYLGVVRDTALSAFEHQDLPFDMIVEASGVARQRGLNPLVQVLFVMNNLPVRNSSLDGLKVEVLPALASYSKFDMALFLDTDGDGLRGTWQFASALFKPERINQLAKAWIHILEQIASEPDIRLGDIKMISDTAVAAAPAPAAGPKADKLGKFLKKPKAAGPLAGEAPIRESLLAPPQVFPLLVEPNDPGLDLVTWVKRNRPWLEEKLSRHAGILLRGFALHDIHAFEAFAEAVQPGLYGQYGDLPKKEGGKNTYRSTPYPEKKMILFHNESSHQDTWPRKQLFFCEQPSPVGGATPVVDCRQMYLRLPETLRETFEQKGLLYVRTFADKLDVSWQHFFKTDDRAHVEARCRAAGIQWTWLDNDELQIRTPCPAIIRHPLTGEKTFFNQVQLHHIYCLDPDVREDLLALFGIERMPRHVYYGDGSPIEDEVMQEIGDLYEACAVRFDWRKGDVILLDNMLAAHARDPFEGPRKIVVAMGEMVERRSLEAAQPALRPVNSEQEVDA